MKRLRIMLCLIICTRRTASLKLDGDERFKISNQVESLQSIRDRKTKVNSLTDKIKQYLPEIDLVHANGGEDATLPEKQLRLLM